MLLISKYVDTERISKIFTHNIFHFSSIKISKLAMHYSTIQLFYGYVWHWQRLVMVREISGIDVGKVCRSLFNQNHNLRLMLNKVILLPEPHHSLDTNLDSGPALSLSLNPKKVETMCKTEIKRESSHLTI